MINSLLKRAVELGLIALLILFQPELRRVLERMGSSFSSGHAVASSATEQAIAQTVLACTEMSASRTGALIIFERKVKLNDIMSTGTIINSDTTAELLKNLFYNKAPLHDGAVIIRDGRIAAAGCVLPLEKLLRSELISDEDESSKRGFANYIKKFFKVKKYEEDKPDEKTV